MLRAVLLGVLSLATVSCKSSNESAKSQAGVAAGKVIEVSGSVTVRHGDVARPLAKGETVEGDDTIETGADGHVVIELVHNNASWELSANKTSKVRESLAWSEPKRDRTAKAVEQDTAAAGRPAERNAAETTASAVTSPEPAMAPPTAAPAAATAPADTAAAPAPKAAPKVERARSVDAPAPPPPPAKTATRALPPPAPTVQPDPSASSGGAKGGAAKHDVDGLGISGTGEGGGGTGQPGLGSIGSVGRGGGDMHNPGDAMLRAKTADIAACWGDQKFELQLIVVVSAKGVASTKLSTTSKVTPQIEACVKKIVGAIEFPAAAARHTITVRK